MDITSLGVASVAAITVLCYLIGMGVRISPLDSKYIPLIMGLAGALLGAAGMVGTTRLPDIITAVAVGIVSGLAATGVDQVLLSS